MLKALTALDQKIAARGFVGVNILIGGGSAFSLAHNIPIKTADVDGVLFKSPIDMAQIDSLVKATGRELKIAPDWLNPYFGTFLFSLPPDYGDRLIQVYSGKSLQAFALGLTDLLIMKSFAGREKDILHAKLIIKKGADISQAEQHIESLLQKGIPGAQEALDFLLEVEDQLGG